MDDRAARTTTRPSPVHLLVWSAYFTIAAAAMIGRVVADHGPRTAAAAMFLAAVPFAMMAAAVAATQTHRPEPRRTRRWAAAYGAFAATLSALVIVRRVAGTTPDDLYTAVVVISPIVEELTKAAGLVLLVRWGRIRTALDGAIYACLIGAGFAATENVLYFLRAMADQAAGADGALLNSFLSRGIGAPFAHPLFTALVGTAIGAAAGTRPGRRVMTIVAGVAAAIGLHVAWNHAAITGILDRYATTIATVVALAAIAGAVAVHNERQRLLVNVADLDEPDAQIVTATADARHRQRRSLPWRQRARHDDRVRDLFHAATRTPSEPAPYPVDPDRPTIRRSTGLPAPEPVTVNGHTAGRPRDERSWAGPVTWPER